MLVMAIYLLIGVEPMESGQRRVCSLWEVSVQYGLGQVGREHLFYVLEDFPRLRHEVPINAQRSRSRRALHLTIGYNLRSFAVRPHIGGRSLLSQETNRASTRLRRPEIIGGFEQLSQPCLFRLHPRVRTVRQSHGAAATCCKATNNEADEESSVHVGE